LLNVKLLVHHVTGRLYKVNTFYNMTYYFFKIQYNFIFSYKVRHISTHYLLELALNYVINSPQLCKCIFEGNFFKTM